MEYLQVSNKFKYRRGYSVSITYCDLYTSDKIKTDKYRCECRKAVREI